MREKIKELVVSVIIIIILLPFTVPIISSWSKINCRTEEINIKTGQLRFRRYFYYLRISEKVEDTIVSKLIDKPVEFKEIKPWWTINTFGPYTNHSPYHIFHTKIWGDMQLSSLNDKNKTADEQKEIAVRLLENWQTYAYELTQRR